MVLRLLTCNYREIERERERGEMLVAGRTGFLWFFVGLLLIKFNMDIRCKSVLN